MRTMLPWLFASRRPVVLLAAGILLLLDLGRSLYAHVGYAIPAEPWQAAPYQALAWPPGTDLADTTPLGQQVYVKRCALCHGPEGRGDGPAAPSQIPRPRDFTLGLFKYKSTPAGQPPLDEDLIHVIRAGLQASAMPYWGDILSEEETLAVVTYIKEFSAAFDGLTRQPVSIPPRVAPDEASLGRGEVVFKTYCAACHGQDGRQRLTLRDNKGYPVMTRDLTAPWTFRGGSNPEDIWLRITTGLAPSPMPPFAGQLTPEERWDVVNYVLATARIPAWEPGGVLDGPGQQDDLQQRGEYLVHLAMCGLCHTQINADMIYSGDQYYLAGGMGIAAYPQGTFVSRNLTPDDSTGLGRWTVEEIASAIREGKAKDRALNFWAMPWMFLHSLTQEDALAIATYLKSRPAVSNRIPPPLYYGFLETILAKIFYSEGLPPLGNPITLSYKMGNYGQTARGILPRDWPQRVLILLQWLVLLGGVVAYVIALRRDRPHRPEGRGCLSGVITLFGLVLLAFLLWVFYRIPVLPFIPPAQINQAVTADIYHPEAAALTTPETAALVARGEYLYKVTSCAFCHGGDGSGGAKISQQAFGTLWARNLTSDPTTGIGGWSDAEIARAIRSGVASDGRPLHWQGMIWDHLSNLEEEDMRALISYLRLLSPREQQVPAAVPPAADDCAEYTFFLVDSWTSGCAP